MHTFIYWYGKPITLKNNNFMLHIDDKTYVYKLLWITTSLYLSHLILLPLPGIRHFC